MSARLETMIRFPVPPREPGDTEASYRMLLMEVHMKRGVGFHLPTEKGIWAIVVAAELASNGAPATILSLGSGQAFTEACLKVASPETVVIATDPFLTHGTEEGTRHHPVERLDAMAAIRKYARANMLFLFVWPNYDDPWSGEALQRIVEIATPFTHVVHVGDIQPGGFTGSALFHELLEEHFELVATAPTAKWPYREDIVAVYKFKAPKAVLMAPIKYVISGRPFSGPIADYRRELDALVKPSKPGKDASSAEVRCCHLAKAAYDVQAEDARRRHGLDK